MTMSIFDIVLVLMKVAEIEMVPANVFQPGKISQQLALNFLETGETYARMKLMAMFSCAGVN